MGELGNFNRILKFKGAAGTLGKYLYNQQDIAWQISENVLYYSIMKSVNIPLAKQEILKN